MFGFFKPKPKPKVYAPGLDPDNLPRGTYKTLNGVIYHEQSEEYRSAVREARRKRRERRDATHWYWAKKYMNGEFVEDPTSVWPVHVQKKMWEEGNYTSEYWERLYWKLESKGYGRTK